MSMPIHETARAKINLTLRVLGRRADGYHAIESLVAFADVGDHLELTPGADRRVQVSGPFAGDIVGRNLLDRAFELLRERDAGLALGSVRLEKNLPVAAGLGGGSADAAALLRAVRRANPRRAGNVDWQEVAARLGADVPVCLAGATAVISGIGDRIEPTGAAAALPAISTVLVNPRLPLSTADVYRALAAMAGPSEVAPPPSLAITPFADLATLLNVMREGGNDLERPAAELLPVIAEVKARLSAQQGCLLAAMSGSGPTCFGVFANGEAARRAAAALAATHPGWWVVATRLGAGAPRSAES
jgi:4-diphosphocytidyl-2-C-methyl-D-erythritol kinase